MKPLTTPEPDAGRLSCEKCGQPIVDMPESFDTTPAIRDRVKKAVKDHYLKNHSDHWWSQLKSV